jgi:isopentenyldiphosphate isomerase
MKETLIDVLDENGKPTGGKKSKQEIHLEGLWHNAAHIWIYNSKGEILFQLRAKDKDSYPGLLDISAAGHVDSGETPIQAALREAEEELGLKLTENDLKEVGIRKVSKYIPEIKWQNNEIDHVYLYKYDGDINDLEFPDREVDALEWVSAEKLKEELNRPDASKKYVMHDDYYDFVIKEVEKELK